MRDIHIPTLVRLACTLFLTLPAYAFLLPCVDLSSPLKSFSRQVYTGRRSTRITRFRAATEGVLQKVEDNIEAQTLTAPSEQKQMRFASGLGLNMDLEAAIRTAAEQVERGVSKGSPQDLLFIFVSSVYEGSYDFEQVIPLVRKHLPLVKNIIGCTTSGVVGGEKDGHAQEIETKATFGMALASLPDVELRFFRASPAEMKTCGEEFASLKSLTGIEPSDLSDNLSPGESCFMLWPTPSTLEGNVLAKLLTSLNVVFPFSTVVGGVASAVSQLSNPRVFLWTEGDIDSGQVHADGLVGVHLTGNIIVTTFEAPCVKPLGPVFQIVEVDEYTITKVKQQDPPPYVLGLYEEEAPMSALWRVMKDMTREDMEMLRLDTYIGMSEQLTVDQAYDGLQYWANVNKYVVQKITEVNLGNGAATVTALPRPGALLRFFARDREAAVFGWRFALRDFLDKLSSMTKAVALEELIQLAKRMGLSEDDVTDDIDTALQAMKLPKGFKGALLFGSSDRGSKLFWDEALEPQLFQKYIGTPLAGFHSYGPIGPSATGDSSLVGSSSMYVILSEKFSRKSEVSVIMDEEHESDDQEEREENVRQTIRIEERMPEIKQEDKLQDEATELEPVDSGLNSTPSFEVEKQTIPFSMGQGLTSQLDEKSEMKLSMILSLPEETDSLIVRKRDMEGSAPINVAQIKWYVAEKMPQPDNRLEAIVWEREAEVDRIRERWPVRQVLLEVKKKQSMASPVDFVTNIRAHIAAGGVPIIAEIMKSLPRTGVVRNPYQPRLLAQNFELQGVTAISCSVDGKTLGGSFEDLREVSDSIARPVVANDFVAYGYQLYKALTSGATAVKLTPSILAIKDLQYMHKVALTLGLIPLVVVSSRRQMLEVLEHVSDLRAVVITDKDMSQWKTVAGKAKLILSDLVVQQRLANHPSLMLIQDSVVGLSDIGRKLPSTKAASSGAGSPSDRGFELALVGEAIMSATDPVAALREVIARVPSIASMSQSS